MDGWMAESRGGAEEPTAAVPINDEVLDLWTGTGTALLCHLLFLPPALFV